VAVEEELARLARGYRSFAEVEAAEASPLYARLALAVAEDEQILRFLAGMPVGKRQPNLLFAAVQYLHGTPVDVATFRRRLAEDTDRVRTTMLERATQTNEPARCAALLPLLAAVPGPLALVEVGASAGLCLYPDRYGYDYDGAHVGPPSRVELTCHVTGEGPVPSGLPDVRARLGIDLNPLDVTDPDVRAWLRALIWPGPHAAERLARLEAAAEVAREDPPRILAGDLVERLPDVLALVPPGCTPVVFSTALMVYVPRARRQEFADLVGSLPVRWIAQEPPEAFPDVAAELPPGEEARGRFLLSMDGVPLAWTAPHGGRVDWFPGARLATTGG
jgi:hypothetical protein